MKQLMKHRYDQMHGEDREGGFTLVELLVVIVILAILAAVVVIAVGGITDKGQSSACKADKRTLETAEEAFYAQNTTYTSEAALAPKYIAQTSSLYDITVTGGGTGYTVGAVAGSGCS